MRGNTWVFLKVPFTPLATRSDIEVSPSPAQDWLCLGESSHAHWQASKPAPCSDALHCPQSDPRCGQVNCCARPAAWSPPSRCACFLDPYVSIDPGTLPRDVIFSLFLIFSYWLCPSHAQMDLYMLVF